MPEHERDAIFERFTRGSRTGGEGGFGLGLAIGRELAERLGGASRSRTPTGSPAPGSSSRCPPPRRAGDRTPPARPPYDAPASGSRSYWVDGTSR